MTVDHLPSFILCGVVKLFQKANYYGSFLQSSTACLGSGPDGDVYVPFRDLLPMVHPNDVIFDGKESVVQETPRGL